MKLQTVKCPMKKVVSYIQEPVFRCEEIAIVIQVPGDGFHFLSLSCMVSLSCAA